jgi:hypothetical protein
VLYLLFIVGFCLCICSLLFPGLLLLSLTYPRTACVCSWSEDLSRPEHGPPGDEVRDCPSAAQLRVQARGGPCEGHLHQHAGAAHQGRAAGVGQAAHVGGIPGILNNSGTNMNKVWLVNKVFFLSLCVCVCVCVCWFVVRRVTEFYH